jgi:hypothetical protein
MTAKAPCGEILVFKPRPYQTADSTIDAFKYLVRLNDPERLKAWLARKTLQPYSSFWKASDDTSRAKCHARFSGTWHHD